MYKIKVVYEFDIPEETIEKMRREYSKYKKKEYPTREYMDILCEECNENDFAYYCKDCEQKASWEQTDN